MMVWVRQLYPARQERGKGMRELIDTAVSLLT